MRIIIVVLLLLSGIASVIGLVVPGVSSVAQSVEAALGQASAVFNTINATMTAAAVQQPVGQIATLIGGALTAAKQAATALPPASAGQVNNLLAEADTILSDLTTFAATAQLPVAAPVAAHGMFAPIGGPQAPVHLFVRRVA